MKNQKIKMFTLMLASVLGAAALSGAALVVPAKADETTVTDAYAVSDVFSASGATLNTSGDVTSFAIKNDGAGMWLARRRFCAHLGRCAHLFEPLGAS
jgi:hypothetical protein